MAEQRLIDLVAGERVVSSIGSKPDVASARVMLVPLPPKSSSATTPLGESPALACSAVSDATASETRRAGRRNASFSARTGGRPQCAGTAIAISEDGWPPPASIIASSAWTSSRSAWYEDPSAPTSGTASPTRSTKPYNTMPSV